MLYEHVRILKENFGKTILVGEQQHLRKIFLEVSIVRVFTSNECLATLMRN